MKVNFFNTVWRVNAHSESKNGGNMSIQQFKPVKEGKVREV